MNNAFKYAVCLMTLYCMTATTFAQTNSSLESLSNVSDSVIKKEISYFTKTGKLSAENALQAKPIEIPISNCNGNAVNWAASKFFSSISTFIHIYFLQDSSIRKIDSILLITHSHFWVKFPKNAYSGITTSALCNFSGGKKNEFYSDYYKAFYSNDKKRLYIYLLGGTTNNQYEVTWIVVNDKYWGRVIDKVE